MKAINGYAEGLMQTMEAAYPPQEIVDLVTNAAASMLAVLESNDLSLEDTNFVLNEYVQKAAQSKSSNDPQLHSAFSELIVQYTRGKLNGLISKRKLSTLKLDK